LLLLLAVVGDVVVGGIADGGGVGVGAVCVFDVVDAVIIFVGGVGCVVVVVGVIVVAVAVVGVGVVVVVVADHVVAYA